ncbi:hypothetical protein L9F63_000281 [Diploptera punctata]|uniref:GPI ethanolamine phosphate transferase 1 n=1 Tax=Diploptera punctata TaxID=6984 RepID=A0AAD8APQ3_DIPPU|nr:hypothetical protein L9F63_000281 [Diploptera punctata]
MLPDSHRNMLYCPIFICIFPMKKHVSPISSQESLPNSIGNVSLNGSELYKPSIGRLVLMVIDALRWDFIGDAEGRYNMPYTTSLIKRNKGCLFKGQSGPPTVTMPRIKAMTTGTVPSFADVALNLGSSKIMDDNLLLQTRNNGLKLISTGMKLG